MNGPASRSSWSLVRESGSMEDTAEDVEPLCFWAIRGDRSASRRETGSAVNVQPAVNTAWSYGDPDPATYDLESGRRRGLAGQAAGSRRVKMIHVAVSATAIVIAWASRPAKRLWWPPSSS